MSETCAKCGKPVLTNEWSYHKFDPYGGVAGKTYHSHCGDLFGHKAALAAKDAEIVSLRAELSSTRMQVLSWEREANRLRADQTKYHQNLTEIAQQHVKDLDRLRAELDAARRQSTTRVF
jgi:septal ring factor EnvC (AmiA/AmiB activator)